MKCTQTGGEEIRSFQVREMVITNIQKQNYASVEKTMSDKLNGEFMPMYVGARLRQALGINVQCRYLIF